MTGSHRVAYELAFGEIPDGMKVLHKCDNPPCCRPDHLFLGMDADNSADKVAKRRHTFGSTNPNHKLTEEDVRDIQAASNAGVQRVALARRFGVAGPTISNIANRRRWTHVK